MQGRFGVSWAEGILTVGGASGRCDGGTAALALGLAVHANDMHRFRGASCFGASSTFLWAIETACAILSLATMWSLNLSNFISGSGGLGVFVREGLVNPVSQVRSAVEAKLTLLVMERRRPRSVGTECVSMVSSSSSEVL